MSKTTSPIATTKSFAPAPRLFPSEKCSSNNPELKKKAPPEQGRSLKTRSVRLEDNLAHELHVEGLARPDARRAVEVTDSVGNQTAARDRSRSGGKVDAVEHVVHLRAQLHPNPFGYGDVLDDREVHVGETGPNQLVTTDITQETRGSRAARSPRDAVCGRVIPLNTRLVEGTINPRQRIPDLIQTRSYFTEGLSAVERPQAAELPPVSQDLRTMRGTRNIVGPESSEVVPRVEVPATVLRLQVKTVQRNRAAVLRHLIQFVCPSVGELRSEPVERPHFQGRLQRVVVGCSNAVELVDGPDVGELRAIRIELVDVQHHRQLTALAPNVTQLKHGSVAQARLNVQVVVVEVRCPEVLVYRIDVKQRSATV